MTLTILITETIIYSSFGSFAKSVIL